VDRVDRVETLTRRRALERGYWFARGLLDAPPLTALRGQVLEICARRGWLEGRRGFAHDSPEFPQLQLEVHSLPAFDALRRDARLRAALEELLGGAVRDRQGDVCRLLFPAAGEFTTPPHRDQTYMQRADAVWTAWIPLADCPRRQGSLAVLPRSNRLGLGNAVPPGARWQRFDFAAGDVLFVHSLTLHRSLVNRSAEIRVSVDYRYSSMAAMNSLAQ
jgi:diadenosine tetraphosphatase ApaH/serine/threonine PP2A family protein phosphatase